MYYWLCIVPNILLSSRSLLKLCLTFIPLIKKKNIANLCLLLPLKHNPTKAVINPQSSTTARLPHSEQLGDDYVYKLARNQICIRIWLRVITEKWRRNTVGNRKKKKLRQI